ncbi:MbcA/ParS/Xre antitoxin family protein [Thalassospira sp. GB04J01]|uniref:MbcA/ParS/Xre antitoxin family protein n=1 Tax=Thalassospira sp. GB04J01 TaxID=1485225 RepID=UPI000C9C5C85|nr:MbcA/ParS/Xre antitoxin family protein [Thalassospira sp. GB04J01]|tara:strand:- start:638 stop:1150 length:513 start_codon:yes stop_codon:yes gene_type:complete
MSDQVRDAIQVIGSARTSASDRKRLSGPGLRAFHSITDIWGLTHQQRCILLGDPAISTYRRWIVKTAKHEAITLSKDTLIRISAILGIHKQLTNLFVNPAEAMTWLQASHTGIVFSGLSPLEVMLLGTQDDLLTVRRYLDDWPYGPQGNAYTSTSFSPVKPEDLVFRESH